jgi:segregation and condensation protein B
MDEKVATTSLESGAGSDPESAEVRGDDDAWDTGNGIDGEAETEVQAKAESAIQEAEAFEEAEAAAEPEATEEAPAEPAAEQEDAQGAESLPSASGDLQESLTPEQLQLEPETADQDLEEQRLRAILEAIVYITEEPLSLDQIAGALQQSKEKVRPVLESLVAEYDQPCHGVTIRELAGGYRMATKAEHHDEIRTFVRALKAPLKLSLAALETLAVIAYKQPITAPEIMEIRGVQGAGVLKTLLDRKLITTAGRKNVVGKPILYKTTKEFLVQFGLKSVQELPTLKEFEELRRLALNEDEVASPGEQTGLKEDDALPAMPPETPEEAAAESTGVIGIGEGQESPGSEAAAETRQGSYPDPSAAAADAAGETPGSPEVGDETVEDPTENAASPAESAASELSEAVPDPDDPEDKRV